MPPRKRPATARTHVTPSQSRASAEPGQDVPTEVAPSVELHGELLPPLQQATGDQAEPTVIEDAAEVEPQREQTDDIETEVQEVEPPASVHRSRMATPPPPNTTSSTPSPEMRKNKSSPSTSVSPTLASASAPTPEKRKALRPPLPDTRNPLLPDDVVVKLQVVERQIEGEERNILVGRVKLPFPAADGERVYGFLLKYFETDAIMADTMFDLTFPSASAEERARELEFLSAFAVQVSPAVFPGTWISSDSAETLAEEYGIAHLLAPLVEAQGTIIAGDAYFLDSEGQPSHAHNAKPLTEEQRERLLSSTSAEEPAIGEGPQEELILPDAQEALDAAREEARAIQSLASSSGSKETKRRAEDMETPSTMQAVMGMPPLGRKIITPARVRALLRSHPVRSGIAGGLAATVAATAAGVATGVLPSVDWAAALSAVQAGMISVQHWFV